MNNTLQSSDLSGKLLIAMPGMGDPRFEKSVIFMCAHSDEGAMGLIINKPAPEVKLDELLKQMGIEQADTAASIMVHFGGPVEHGRGFVLHSAEYEATEATLKVDETFALSATLDVLEDIATGGGPDQSFLALGYAGWAPGQLEAELQENGWLTTDSSAELVFGTGSVDKWATAIRSMGIDPLMLSAEGGRA